MQCTWTHSLALGRANVLLHAFNADNHNNFLSFWMARRADAGRPCVMYVAVYVPKAERAKSRTLTTPKQTITIIRMPYKTNAVDRRDDSVSYAVSSLCSQFIYLLFLFVSCVVVVVVAVAYLAICIIFCMARTKADAQRSECVRRREKKMNRERRKERVEASYNSYYFNLARWFAFIHWPKRRAITPTTESRTPDDDDNGVFVVGDIHNVSIFIIH